MYLRKDIKLEADSTLDLSGVTQILVEGTRNNNKTYFGNVIFRRVFGLQGVDIAFKGILKLPDRAPDRAK